MSVARAHHARCVATTAAAAAAAAACACVCVSRRGRPVVRELSPRRRSPRLFSGGEIPLSCHVRHGVFTTATLPTEDNPSVLLRMANNPSHSNTKYSRVNALPSRSNRRTTELPFRPLTLGLAKAIDSSVMHPH